MLPYLTWERMMALVPCMMSDYDGCDKCEYLPTVEPVCILMKTMGQHMPDPCVSQLWLCSLIVHFSRRSSGWLGREDLNRDDLEILRSYYEESFGFPYLLDLGGTIRGTTDLGDLW